MFLNTQVKEYLDYCIYGKNLNNKTIYAYKVDLKQFVQYCDERGLTSFRSVDRNDLREYIKKLHDIYKTKTIKRKLACIKGAFRYMYVEGIIEDNPFFSLETHFREEKELPKVVSKTIVEKILDFQYDMYHYDKLTHWKQRFLLRDIVVIEMLFVTGVRVSELCGVRKEAVDYESLNILIKGKGSKERIAQIGNSQIRNLFHMYIQEFWGDINKTGWLFVTKNGTRFSEQAARAMVRKYRDMLGIKSRITPHMFRHAFATCLLDEDVDIRCIQELLGHSSIRTTQIYCHVSADKQRRILEEKHPRNKMNFMIS